MKGKFKVYGIIPPFLNGFKRYFLTAFLAVSVTAILNTLTPQIVRFTVDSLLGDIEPTLPQFLTKIYESYGGKEFFNSNLWVIGGLMIAISFVSGISNYVFKMSVSRASQGVIKNIRDATYLHILKLPFSWHSSHKTGDIIQRVTNDMEVVRRFIAEHIIETTRILYLIAVTLYMMMAMNVTLSLIAIAFVPIIVGYTSIFYGRIRNLFTMTDEAEGELVSVVQENLTGVRVVRAFGTEASEMKKFDQKNTHFSDIWIGLGYTMGAYWGLGDLFTGLQGMTVLSVGTIIAVNGGLTLGELIAFMSYNTILIWPIRRLGRMFSEMSKSSVSFERLAYILNAQPEDENINGYKKEIKGDIVFENVSYKYIGSDRDVLRDINLKLSAGKTLGILGGTGSGKSTLVHLLNRLYEPTEGRILIDGVDIKEMSLPHLRKNVGMVLQEPFLFSKSIKDNIAIVGNITDKEIEEYATTASIHKSILDFKDGYDTIVGERGVTLSGGQKQRVAIARMLTSRAPIMVFDDSLSALDSETDYAVRTALKNRPTASTTLIISHRINSIMHADNIIVIKDGSIFESGTHAELISKDGVYKKIYDIQFNSDDRFIEEVSE